MRAPYPPLTRSPFPNGEGLGGATLRVNSYKGRCPIKNLLALSSGKGRRAKRGGVGIPACENTASRSQPPLLRGASFQRKEGVCRLPASSFRAKARNLFRLRSRKDVGRGITGNTVLPTTSSRIESQPPPLRGTSFQRKEGVCRLPASSFRAKARNLFRLRSRKDVGRGITGNTVLPTTSSRIESQLPPPSGYLLPKEGGRKVKCVISTDFHPRNN